MTGNGIERSPEAIPAQDAATPRPTDPSDYTVAFTPRQIGGFVVLAALVLAFVRWLRRPRGKG
jgi:hypothetical protein